MPWYKTGTVKTTINTNAIVGTGTSFIANARVGDAFKGPDGAWYEVTNIASDTAMSIAPNYAGPTVAAGTYAITPVQGYVKDLADQAKAMILQWGTTLAGLGTVATENVVPITKGGTGAITAPLARTALGLGTVAVENILPVAKGGTGATTIPLARTALGLVPQTSVSDASAGRLMLTGAFGEGGIATPNAAAGVDVNTLVNPGRYVVVGTSPNMADIGDQYIDVYATTAGTVRQFASSDKTTDTSSRVRVGGTWSEWVGGGSGSGLPLGTAIAWNISEATIPGGWIARNGQILNRADWPELWTLISGTTVSDTSWISTPTLRGKYSSGNGTTTFRMPDDNGKHSDGLGLGAVVQRGYGKNSSGVVGEHQADQMQAHKHRLTQTGGAGAPELDGVDVPGGVVAALGAGSVNTGQRALSGVPYTGPDVGNPATGGNARSGSETRMVNTTVIWCTVAAVKAVNVGTVDVTALATTVASQASKIQNVEGAIPMRGVSAYVSFNGTGSPAILSGYGVDSVTRNAVGDYTINFTAGFLTKATYAWSANAMDTDASGDAFCGRPFGADKTTSKFRFKVMNGGSTAQDSAEVSVLIFGGV